MSINRELGKTVAALDATTSIYGCSSGGTITAVDLNGAVIDRLGLKTNHLSQYDRCLTAEPWLKMLTTVGTTFLNKKVTAKVRLQHGDSSGAGDMADLVQAWTTDASATATYYTSAMTTDYTMWTTGVMKNIVSAPAFYELTAAKRYLRVVGLATVPGNSTVAAGDVFTVDMGIRFGEFTNSPPVAQSTSTSTST